jgi:hypothetical protein
MARDLVHADPWRESLERSLARRRTAERRATARASGQGPRVPSYPQLCWQAMGKHALTLMAAAGAILSLVLLSAAQPGVSDGQGVRASALIGGARTRHAPPTARSRSGAAHPSRSHPCEPGSRGRGYVNPLASASVSAKRIDQGVDYVGSGALSAIGDATITYISLSDTGWPGAFIEYQLRSGPETGCYVFYAEGVTPVQGLRVGQRVRGGQAIATIDPTNTAGIEIGWGAGSGTKTYAAKQGLWGATAEADNIPTSPGLSFSSLIASLGGPPGKVLMTKSPA